MKYSVKFSTDAEEDLFDIYCYIESVDSQTNAEEIINKLKALCHSLDELPGRGHIPPELEFVGVSEYREVHFNHYRVIYRIVGNEVIVHCVLDDRRDLQSLLERRLLR